jgi:hypothetical protein
MWYHISMAMSNDQQDRVTSNQNEYMVMIAVMVMSMTMTWVPALHRSEYKLYKDHFGDIWVERFQLAGEDMVITGDYKGSSYTPIVWHCIQLRVIISLPPINGRHLLSLLG